MKKHLLLLFAALLPLVASAHDFEGYGIYYNITSDVDKTVEVTYKGNFYDSYDNEYFGNITIPATVTYEEVTYSVTGVGKGAFDGCYSLTSITLPESVTSIGEQAFYHCSNLTSITLPEGVTRIGDDAFYGCTSLASITLPEGVTRIGNYAFYDCTSLASITLPEGVTDIGNLAFMNCHSLTSITLPEGVTSIGEQVFSNCTSLASITLPEGVTDIGNLAFMNCHSLASITLPEGVTRIGYGAFSDCTNLASITLPEGVTGVGEDAFYGCSSLTSIICKAVTPPTMKDDTFYNVDKSILVYVPEESVEEYKAASYWSDFSNIVAMHIKIEIDGVWYTTLTGPTREVEVTFKGDSYNSYDNEYSGDITIPATVTYEEVTYSVTGVGERAFKGCYSLNAITLPKSVRTIGSGAFWGCSSLTAITLPEGVAGIGNIAFFGCTNLATITLPESVASIGEHAFYDCSSLTDVYCHAVTVPSTEANAFDYSNIGDATLHVPASAVESYTTTAPWSSFGTIVTVTTDIKNPERTTQDSPFIYDLRGHRVTDLTKGIYIIGGHKVMVKD